MSLGVASAGTVEAHLGEHVDVEGGRHRDLGRGDAGEALDGPAHLEQRHRVGVGAAAELDVGRHAATLSQSLDGARRAPSSRPRPEVWPTRARAAARDSSPRCRAPPARPRTPGSPRRASRSRAASRRAAWWCGPAPGRPRRPRACRSPAARCAASQPHSTSSPYGVSPSPRPTRAATSIAPGACRSAASRGTDTSTSRPTTSGWSSRCRTPSRTDAADDVGQPVQRRAQRARHRGRPGADHPDAPAGHVDVHRVGAAVQQRRRPVGTRPQVGRHARGRAHRDHRPDVSRRDTYRPVTRRSHHWAAAGVSCATSVRAGARAALCERHINVDVQVGRGRSGARRAGGTRSAARRGARRSASAPSTWWRCSAPPSSSRWSWGWTPTSRSCSRASARSCSC